MSRGANASGPRHQAGQIYIVFVFPIEERGPLYELHLSRLILHAARVVRHTLSFYLQCVVFLLILKQHPSKYGVPSHLIAFALYIMVSLVANHPVTSVTTSRECL